MALRRIVDDTCTHGQECYMFDTIAVQSWVSLSIALLILVIGLFLIFTKESEKIVFKKVKVKDAKKKLDLSGLDKEEKAVINLLKEESGAMFQSALMEKLEIGKVKTTRLLDKLEAKQLIERKRRGMNNVIVLKQ